MVKNFEKELKESNKKEKVLTKRLSELEEENERQECDDANDEKEREKAREREREREREKEIEREEEREKEREREEEREKEHADWLEMNEEEMIRLKAVVKSFRRSSKIRLTEAVSSSVDTMNLKEIIAQNEDEILILKNQLKLSEEGSMTRCENLLSELNLSKNALNEFKNEIKNLQLYQLNFKKPISDENMEININKKENITVGESSNKIKDRENDINEFLDNMKIIKSKSFITSEEIENENIQLKEKIKELQIKVALSSEQYDALEEHTVTLEKIVNIHDEKIEFNINRDRSVHTEKDEHLGIEREREREREREKSVDKYRGKEGSRGRERESFGTRINSENDVDKGESGNKDKDRNNNNYNSNSNYKKYVENDKIKKYNSSEKSDRSWRASSSVMRWNSSLTEGSEIDSSVTIAELNNTLKEREYELNEKQVVNNFILIFYLFIFYFLFILNFFIIL